MDTHLNWTPILRLGAQFRQGLLHRAIRSGKNLTGDRRGHKGEDHAQQGSTKQSVNHPKSKIRQLETTGVGRHLSLPLVSTSPRSVNRNVLLSSSRRCAVTWISPGMRSAAMRAVLRLSPQRSYENSFPR